MKPIFWPVILLLPIALIVLVWQVITPFIISIIIAYLFNPTVDVLSKAKIPRSISAGAIILLFFTFILGFVIIIGPLLYSQYLTLLEVIPKYLSSWQESNLLNYQIKIDEPQLILKKYSDQIINIMTTFINNFWSSTMAMINILSLIFITPIITFYTLRDWHLITNSIDKMIPKKHYKVFTEQINKIDNILSGYIRGQTQVCLILGLFYTIGLYFTGLNYSFFIGFFTGIFSFIPYIGFTSGFIIGNIISFFQFESWLSKAAVIGVFVLGQVLENSVVTPKLIGNNVKLHPIWIIFAIFIGGALFGFLGVLLAIPVAAVFGVLIRFIIHKYFQSKLYNETTQSTE
ncbi:MAG: AI-2E family transporter [Rickettsiaceae bacterium H1]|nr:AI-2E family transporter [Rickettsiaceae bacterium H1]